MGGASSMLRRARRLKTQFARYAGTVAGLARRRLPGNRPFTLFCLILLAAPLLVALFFSVAYCVSFIYGLRGALPCREFFLIFPSFAALFGDPRSIAETMFAYALLGASLSWLLRAGGGEWIGKVLSAPGHCWNILSFFFIASLLLATLGQIYISFETPSYSILGLLPHSDANVHSLNYSKYFYEPAMGDFALRRPMAAFLGAGIHWLAGQDAAGALMVRCLLVSCAMWASCSVINRFCGVWSAVACLAIEYYHVGKFSGICMTESLGFFWGCCAVVLWLEALHRKRLFWDAAAFTVTLIGLLTRMGSMFLVPALFIYVLWSWRRRHPARGWWRAPLLSLCLCVGAVLALDTAFSSRGFGETNQTGANFSSTLAGLTLGTDWTGPHKVYARELAALNGDKERSDFLYKQAVKNILHHPGVFLRRLMEGEAEFVKNLHFFLFYNWWVVCLLCLLLLARRSSLFPADAGFFWAAVWIAVFLSIPFIYFDESRRVNIFVYPFIACFFSLALARPGPHAGAPGERAPAAAWLTLALSGAIVLVMASVAFFPRLHLPEEMARVRSYLASLPAPAPGTVLAAPRGTGFLVVPDGESGDTSVPVMPWTAFRERYAARSQKAAPFLEALASRLPFAVLELPVLRPSDWPHADAYFIAPPEVLTRQDVALWKFAISRQIPDRHWHIRWNMVTSATPALSK